MGAIEQLRDSLNRLRGDIDASRSCGPVADGWAQQFSTRLDDLEPLVAQLEQEMAALQEAWEVAVRDLAKERGRSADEPVSKSMAKRIAIQREREAGTKPVGH